MNKSLFNAFDPVSEKQWKQRIQYDLAGADYNATLVWTSPEGIPVKPFYCANTTPPLTEALVTKASQFKICDTIVVENVKQANTAALAALNAGADSIKFKIHTANSGLKLLLEGIDLKTTTVFLDYSFLPKTIAKHYAEIHTQDALFCATDIIGHLAKTGCWHQDLKTDFSDFEMVINTTRSFSINTALYQNAGANMVQQLAYAMCHANEYFNYINTHLNAPEAQPFTVVFYCAIGANYFFEIAKLKALRWLFNSISKAYNANYNCHIFATPTARNTTIYDATTNMIRSTTECMSAILGGADTICNLPYDTQFRHPNAFSTRTARHQLLILKHEADFDAVDNPTDGSYYLDSLTEQLAEKALILFKDLEAQGGFLKQLKAGTIQRKIKESAAKEEAAFNAGATIRVGSNAYTNPEERIKTALELTPFTKKQNRKTVITPIIEKRLTQNLEQKRLKKE